MSHNSCDGSFCNRREKRAVRARKVQVVQEFLAADAEETVPPR
jgi:hypothetical protein